MSSISGEESISGEDIESSDYHSSSEEESSLDGSDVSYMVGTERDFLCDLISMRENDQRVKQFITDDSFDWIRNMNGEDWEQLGRDISNSSYLRKLVMFNYFDDNSMSPFFRGLTRSSSIRRLSLKAENYICFNGIQSMVPFLQNASNLLELNITGNDDNIISEGFTLLWRALSDSPIKKFTFNNFGMDSFEMDDISIPNNLLILDLTGNNINADGCRQIAKLLRREDATLEELYLGRNKIDDEGISILANALQANTSLIKMNVYKNEAITIEGMKLLLKLVNDISSIKATLQSNHTLHSMSFPESFESVPMFETEIVRDIVKQIFRMNEYPWSDPDSTGKRKVILTQLDSKRRAKMCRLQGLGDNTKSPYTKSPYTELGPLLLPEVLEIVGKRHGLREFYESFRVRVADLWTTVNRKKVVQQRRDRNIKTNGSSCKGKERTGYRI